MSAKITFNKNGSLRIEQDSVIRGLEGMACGRPGDGVDSASLRGDI